MEIAILVIINKENQMEEENTNGLMEVILKVISFQEWDKEKEFGYITTERSMKDNSKKISKTVEAFSVTNLDNTTKVYLKTEVNTKEFCTILTITQLK